MKRKMTLNNFCNQNFYYVSNKYVDIVLLIMKIISNIYDKRGIRFLIHFFQMSPNLQSLDCVWRQSELRLREINKVLLKNM